MSIFDRKHIGAIFVALFVLWFLLILLAQVDAFWWQDTDVFRRFIQTVGMDRFEGIPVVQRSLEVVSALVAVTGFICVIHMILMNHGAWIFLILIGWLTGYYPLFILLYYFLVFRRIAMGNLSPAEGGAYLMRPAQVQAGHGSRRHWMMLCVPLIFLLLGIPVLAPRLLLVIVMVYPFLLIVVCTVSIYAMMALRRANAPLTTDIALVLSWTLFWAYLYWYGIPDTIGYTWLVPKAVLDFSLCYVFFWGIWALQGSLQKWQGAVLLGVPLLLLLTSYLYSVSIDIPSFDRQTITAIAIERRDASLCERISTFADRCGVDPCARIDLCYLEYAKALRDSSACDRIAFSYGDTRRQCFAESAAGE